MTTFSYIAKKNTAETVTGEIHAHSQEEAIDLINNLGLLPVKVDVLDSDKKNSETLRNRKIKPKELSIFSRQLSNLQRSGVTLLRSLAIVEEQSADKFFKNIISQLAWGVKNGRSLSECLGDYPQIFSSLYVTMVRAGEESGNLQEMLLNLANYLQKQEEFVSKIRTALAYPLLMLVVGMGTVYFILTFTLPRMMSLFVSSGNKLPLPTEILLTLSSFLSKTWGIFIILILGLVFFYQKWIKTPNGRFIVNRFLLKTPFLGTFILKTELARFSRTLVLLLKSGVSIIRSLDVAIPVINNDLIKETFFRCQKKLSLGGSFGDAISQEKYIPSLMGHLITIGEESGTINDVLSEVAHSFEQETDEQIKIGMVLFEPLMILFIGLVVGFIVFAMLLPIFQFDALAK